MTSDLHKYSKNLWPMISTHDLFLIKMSWKVTQSHAHVIKINVIIIVYSSPQIGRYIHSGKFLVQVGCVLPVEGI